MLQYVKFGCLSKFLFVEIHTKPVDVDAVFCHQLALQEVTPDLDQCGDEENISLRNQRFHRFHVNVHFMSVTRI